MLKEAPFWLLLSQSRIFHPLALPPGESEILTWEQIEEVCFILISEPLNALRLLQFLVASLMSLNFSWAFEIC